MIELSTQKENQEHQVLFSLLSEVSLKFFVKSGYEREKMILHWCLILISGLAWKLEIAFFFPPSQSALCHHPSQRQALNPGKSGRFWAEFSAHISGIWAEFGRKNYFSTNFPLIVRLFSAHFVLVLSCRDSLWTQKFAAKESPRVFMCKENKSIENVQNEYPSSAVRK